MSNSSSRVGMALVDCLSWESLMKVGKQSLRQLDFEPAIKAFVTASAFARQAEDEEQIQQSHLFLGGAMREWCRVNTSVSQLNQAVKIASTVQAVTSPEHLMYIMMDVGRMYENENNYFMSDALYMELLARAKKSQSPQSAALIGRIERRLFESRRRRGLSGPPGAKEKSI